GGQNIPGALKLFQAKPLSQLLYGAQLGPYPSFTSLEVVQSKFLRAILQVPRWVPNAALRLEVGFMKVAVRAWLAIFNFWLKLIFLPRTLTSLLFVDNYHSTWKRALSLKLKSYGLSMECLIQVGYEMAKLILKQHILEVERHHDLGAISNNIAIDPALITFKPANYFFAHLTKNQHRAFTLARMNVLPSAIQEGKSQKIPYSHSASAGEIELKHWHMYSCTAPYMMKLGKNLLFLI
ncbi:hypothetical protein JRQ81_016570, partial [Phrynocephalus forsythii]